jgi:hypothetical protein
MDLTEAKKVLSDATRGPWMSAEGDGHVCAGYVYAVGEKTVARTRTEFDAEFIAYFDPPKVAAMIARIEELERELSLSMYDNVASLQRAISRANESERGAALEALGNLEFGAIGRAIANVVIDAIAYRAKEQPTPATPTQARPEPAPLSAEKQNHLDVLDRALSEDDRLQAAVLGED